MKKIRVWQIIVIVLILIAIIVGIFVSKKLKDTKEQFEIEKKSFQGKKPATIGILPDNYLKNYYINTTNEEINDIYNKAIKNMFSKHTIIFTNKKINYCEKFDTINGIVYLQQPLYSSDGTITELINNYSVFSSDYVTTYYYNDIDKSILINDIYNPFNTLLSDEEYIENELIDEEDEYIIIVKDEYDFVTKLYINKDEFLINKVEVYNPDRDETLENKVEYTNEKIELPQEIIDYANECIEKYEL